MIYLANEDGSAVTFLADGIEPAWSPNGRTLAFSRIRGGLYVINADGSGLRQVISGDFLHHPSWSPDGRSLAFNGSGNVQVVNPDGTNRRLLYDSEYGAYDPAFSPDGQQIAFHVGTYIDDLLGLWLMKPDGSEARHVGPSNAEAPAWSPDGSEIAVVASETVEMVRADGSGRRLRIPGSAIDPAWTSDGRLLFTSLAAPRDRELRGARIFVDGGGLQQQLIPDATTSVIPGYYDRQAAWSK